MTPTGGTVQYPEYDLAVKLDTWKKQRQFQYAYSAEIATGKKPWEVAGYSEALSDRMQALRSMADEWEDIAADAAKDMKTRNSASALFQQATNAYYDARLEHISNETARAEDVRQAETTAAQKRETFINDSLATMLTHLGTVKESGGRQILVLNAGNPDSKAIAVQVRDALAGSDPELAKSLTNFINAVGKPSWY
jgi:hypothetical protein